MYTRHLDPYKNITYGSVDNEEVNVFVSEDNKQYPIKVEMIGVTMPDREYYISRKHSHYYVLEYVESGEGYLEVGGNKYTLSQDDVYLLVPGVAHKYGADKLNPFRKIWINYFSGFLNEFLVTYGLNNKVVFKNCKEIKKYFIQMLEYARANPVNEDYSIEISKILFNILLTLAERNNEDFKSSVIAQKTKQILDQAIYRKVTIEDVCKEINVSKSQISREFKKYYNTSPYQYLIDKKISMAKQMLISTKMKVSEISDVLCFSDEYNFSNMFKNKVGVSPIEFRKRANNQNEV